MATRADAESLLPWDTYVMNVHRHMLRIIWMTFGPPAAKVLAGAKTGIITTRERGQTRDDRSCQEFHPCNSSSTNHVFYSKHSITMAWRSSGDTNEELVRNLKRKFMPALFYADWYFLVSDRVSRMQST